MKQKLISLAITMALLASSILPPSFSATINKASFSVKAPEYTPMTTSLKGAKVIESYKKGNLLLSQGYYRDASNAGIAVPVAKLTAFGVIDKKSDSFNPYTVLDGYHGIEMVVGMTGEKENVKKRAANNANNEAQSIADRIILREFFIEGKNKGYILPSEEKYINEPVPKYVFLAWLSRAANIQPTAPIENGIRTFSDYNQIPTDYRDLMEGAYEAGIISKSGNALNPQGTINKKDATLLLDKALPKFYNSLGITTDTGLVLATKSELKNIYSVKSRVKNIYLLDKKGKVKNITSVSGSSSARSTDFIYNNRSALSNSGGVGQGHEIRFYKKDDKVVYATRTSGNTIFTALEENALKDPALTFSQGKVVNKKTEFFVENGKKYYTYRIRIKNYNEEMVDFVVKNKLQLYTANNLMIMKNGSPKTLSSLAKNDYIEYYTKEPDKVVFAFVKKENATTSSGQIQDIRLDPKTKKVTLFIYNSKGNLVQYPLEKYANFSFNGTTGTFGDLTKGQYGNFKIKNGYIIGGNIDSYDSAGYIPTNYKKRSGIVTSISSTKLGIKEVTGDKSSFTLNKVSTKIEKNLAPTNYKSILRGDVVDVYLSGYNTSTPSKVIVHSHEKPTKAVYKGIITSVDGGVGKLAVTDAAYLTSLEWKDDPSYIKEFEFTDNSVIYDGTKLLKRDDISDGYKGKTIYMALKNTYGEDQIAHGVIADGMERNYNSKVKSIDKIYGQVELQNKLNLNISPSTIVIKNDRIVPYEIIAKNQDIMVSTATKGSTPYACVVNVVDSVFSPFEGIYFGALDDITPYSFNLQHSSYITGKKITIPSTTASDYFNLGNESFIFDRDTGKYLKPSELYHGNYSSENNYVSPVTEGMNQRYYFGVVITDKENAPNEVKAMSIMKNALVKGNQLSDNSAITNVTALRNAMQNIYATAIFTKGAVAEVDLAQKRIRLTASHDYAPPADMWKPNPENIWVRFDDSVIYKDGRAIVAGELEMGDSLNIVRLTDKSLAIIVK